MPTYDYECKGCGHRFDELQKFSDPVLTKCPACKKNKLERLFGGGGAIIFKGSGFYETDYRRPPEKAADAKPADSGSGGGESKPAEAPKAESKPADTSSGSSGGGAKGGKGGSKKAT